jgi:hypothetical protein
MRRRRNSDEDLRRAEREGDHLRVLLLRMRSEKPVPYWATTMGDSGGRVHLVSYSDSMYESNGSYPLCGWTRWVTFFSDPQEPGRAACPYCLEEMEEGKPWVSVQQRNLARAGANKRIIEGIDRVLRARERKNPDERLRRLERAAATGDRDAQDQLLVRRFRAGETVSVIAQDDGEYPNSVLWEIAFRHPTRSDYFMEPYVSFTPRDPEIEHQTSHEYTSRTLFEYGNPGQGICFYSDGWYGSLSAGGSVVDEARRVARFLTEFGSPLTSGFMESLDTFRINSPGWEYPRTWTICLNSAHPEWERSGPAHACTEWRHLGDLVFVANSLRRSRHGRDGAHYYRELRRTKGRMRGLSVAEFDRLAAEHRVERVREWELE